MKRARTFLRVMTSIVLLLSLSAHAQDFPNKAIRLIVPLAPGGATDLAARIVGERASKYLGQPVFIDNRPGAGGTIGSAAVANAPADGYTILMGTIGTLAISPAMYAKLPYDTDKDLTAVSSIAGGQFALVVSPQFPARNFSEVIRHVKASPVPLYYGSAGNGSTLHLGMELLMSMAGINLTHVPYKGSGPLVAAIIAGEVPIGIPDMPSVMQFVKNGRLRMIAVTGTSREDAFPDVPTIAESGFPDFNVQVWLGIMAPSKTPKHIVDQLNVAIVRALNDADIQSRLKDLGMSATPSSSEDFRKFIARERTTWARVVKAAGVTAN